MEKKQFLQLIDQEYAFEVMLDGNINNKFLSPFRDDNTPSCYVKVSGDNLYFVDNSGSIYYDVLSYCVKAKLKLQYNYENERLAMFYLDNITNGGIFSLGNFNDNKLLFERKNTEHKYQKEQIDWSFDFMEPADYHIKYFERFGVNLLEHEDIKCIERLYKNKELYSVTNNFNLIFLYMENNTPHQIYRPFADKMLKFRNITSVIKGINGVDFSKKTLIITKSTKDIKLLNKLGYNAIAPGSENSTSLMFNMIQNLQKTFDIFLFFDNDSTGFAMSQIYKDKFNLKTIFTDDLSAKDITSYYRKYGYQKTQTLIDEKIR